MLHRVGHAELLAHFHISLGLFSRDCAVRCYGADCLREHDCIIIIGASVPTPRHGDTADFPPYRLESGQDVHVPWTSSAAAAARTKNTPSIFPSFLTSLGGGLASLGSHSHMEMKDIRAVFKVLTPVSAKATLIYTIDPRASIPQFLLNFAIKNLAGILLYVLQTQAAKVHTDQDCKHAIRMRESTAFYGNWLLPKFRDYCACRGWPQPTIAALKEAGIAPAHWEAAPDLVAETSKPTEDEDETAPAVPAKAAVAAAADTSSETDVEGEKEAVRVTLVSAIENLMIDAEEHSLDASTGSSATKKTTGATDSRATSPVSKPVTLASTVERLLDISTPPVQHY
jgi:hypothetical protein